MPVLLLKEELEALKTKFDIVEGERNMFAM